jgi:hypothetical protein
VADPKPNRTRKTPTAATKKPAAREKTPARKPAATPRSRRARPALTHDQVAARAYELHLQGHGDAFANWLRAEEELTSA